MGKLKQEIFSREKVDLGYESANMIAYYKLDNNEFDYFRKHDGISEDRVFYESAIESQKAVFDKTKPSSWLIPNHSDFDFADESNNKPFSISFILTVDSTSSWIVSKRDGSSKSWQLIMLSNELQLTLFDSVSDSNYILAKAPFIPVIDQDYHIVVTVNETTVKFYVDSVLLTTTYANGGSYVKLNTNTVDVAVGKNLFDGADSLDGDLNVLIFWNTDISQTTVDAIYDKQVLNLPLFGHIDDDYQETRLNASIHNNEQTNYFLSFLAAQYNPLAYYKNGFTVFARTGTIENDYKVFLYLLNHSTNKVSVAHYWGDYPANDYHSGSECLFLGNGKILTASEYTHRTSFVMKRSLNAYNISSYETFDVQVVGNIAYPNMVLIGSRIYMIFRTNTPTNSVMYSDDDGETWSQHYNIFTFELSSTHWAYPRVIYSDDKLMYFVNRRNTTVGDYYDKVFYLESTDGDTWSNKAGTFSKNIKTVSQITYQEMETNFLVKDAPEELYIIGATCSWNNNPFYVAQYANRGATEFCYYDSGWLFKTISIEDYVPFHTGMKLLPTAEDCFILYVTAYYMPVPSDNLAVFKIITDDAFDTYSVEILQDDSEYNWNMVAAHNFEDVQKTGIFTSVLKRRGGGSDAEPTDAYSDFKLIDIIN